MNAAQLLAELQARRITVRVKDSLLRIKAPSGALTEDIKQALGVHRDTIVAALCDDKQGKPPIPLAPARAIYRASFAQERLWFLDQYERGASSYSIPTAVRLKGRFDVAAFRKCLDKLVARHGSLRTVFEDVGGEAYQRVLAADSIRIPWRIVNLCKWPRESRESEAVTIVEEELRKSFDLTQGPLLRVLIVDIGGTDHEERIVVFTMHHAISDGWSCEVLLQEFSALYEGHLAGLDVELPPLPIQYVDYAVWQRERLSNDELHRQLIYWRKALANARFALELPTDRPRPPVMDTAGDTIHFELGEDAAKRLRDLARKENATLYTLLLSAFFVLLSRWTGETDICVGTPVANRQQMEIEGLIGFFANTLVVRGDLSGNPDFASLLTRVRSFCLSAQEHQDLPFEQLVDALAPKRDPSRSPLFQIMFSLQNAPKSTFSTPGLEIVPFETRSHTSKFDLAFELLEEADGRLLGEVEFATGLFDRATIVRMTAQYQTLLAAIVDNPTKRLTELDILPTQERRSLLERFNEPCTTFEEGLLHELFAAQAQTTPQTIALIHGDDQLTYEQLDLRANQLAHELICRGVGPDVIVGLCLDRSLDMIVAILATLKAGGAYLPIDPALPNERVATMVEDAAPRVFITLESLRSRLSTSLKAGASALSDRILALDADAAMFGLGRTDNPVTKVRAHNLAYLIFTSGSTGKPKAVAVTHANVMRLFAATKDMFQFSATDVWTLFHSYAFDFSVWEIWGALLYGGRLVIVPFLNSRSPEGFYKLLSENGVTVLSQTPSAFFRLDEVDRLSPDRILVLRLVVFGGEALDQRRLASWFDRHTNGQLRLINMYGITETTVHVTSKAITKEDAQGVGAGTVGRPLADLCCYILDRNLSPAPIGVRGELYVGGSGLARGYLNRPELTAERFVPNPFLGHGERLYRTGDLARFRPDGEIEFLGRADRQVKIRGFRIELGEIEAELARLPGVRGAVAGVEEKSDGDRRLVAWITTDAVDAFDADGAKAALRNRLPDYMVPAAIGALGQIPQTSNGKIDREALPDLELKTAVAAYVAPRTPAEWIIVQAFGDALGLDRVGMDDNFFELGGNSILGLKLVDRLRCSLSEEMSVSAIFHAPTPSALARLISSEARTLASPLVRLGSRAGDLSSAISPLYCIHPAGGSTVRYRPLAQRLDKVCSVYGLQSRALLDPEYKAQSILEMARDYTTLIRRHRPAGPYRLLGWSAGSIIALAITAELERAGERVDFVALLDPAGGVPVNGAVTSMTEYLAAFAEFQNVRLALSDHDLREVSALGADLDDRDRFIAAGLWGRDKGLWSDVSSALLGALYDDSRAFESMLAAHDIQSVDAELHVWWARGAATAAARGWTRGELRAKTLDTCHEQIVVDPIVHDEIAVILSKLQQTGIPTRIPGRSCLARAA